MASPLATLFAALAKRWALGVVEDEAFAAGRSSHAVIDLDMSTLAETDHALFGILCILA